MVLLTAAQRAEYAERGFVVLRNVPGLAPLTARMVEVYARPLKQAPPVLLPLISQSTEAADFSCVEQVPVGGAVHAAGAHAHTHTVCLVSVCLSACLPVCLSV